MIKLNIEVSKHTLIEIKAEIERLDRRKLKSSLKTIGEWWLYDLIYNYGGERIDDIESFVDLP